jgi:dipeptidase D
MQTPLEIFEKIAKDIPRCSKNADKMMDFIANYAKTKGYAVQIDNFGNILCQKNNPKICLQSHYDMVCVGDCSHINPIIENGWMRAKNSSLGADNGIGVAMMLSFMPYFENVEFLFTSDEEIGLIGAKNIELKIGSDKVLNLDSEEEGAVYVACAGGIDTMCKKEFETINIKGDFWEVSLEGLAGGHSGVDIDKKIPNAIIELARTLQAKNAIIGSFHGGEKRNSIPSNAKAIVCIENTDGLDGFKFKKTTEIPVIKDSKGFLEAIVGCPNGVLERNIDLGVVQTSSNIGIITLKNGSCEVRISSRSMSMPELRTIETAIGSHFSSFGFEASVQDFYEPWEWSEDEFCIFIKSVYKKYFINSNFKAIHAGLECAALKKHFPNASFASVGPNIENPHSLQEKVEIDSVLKTYEAIFEILRQTCA